jgi:hypothetical protein
MRLIHLVLSVTVVAALIAGVGAFSVPNLFSMPTFNSLKPQTTLVDPQPAVDSTDGPFTLSLSGNVYLDKIPVSGAEVSVYLNGRYVGKTTAGDLYVFKVPGVKIGDTIRVDASYQGYKGSVSEVVKFKSMYLDAYVSSDRSFIRSALEMMSSEDAAQASQQTAAQSTTPASTGSTGGSGTTTGSADAGQLTNQIWGDTSKLMGSMMGTT